MPPVPPDPTAFTPLAPSVEKAYYRKCIELKRRLNEVETANDEAKIRRVRLDRGIMKMRLERAFLLDEIRKRMDYAAEGSEGSGEEGAATPPPDRPHRDKRRRQGTGPSSILPPLVPTLPKQSSQQSQPPTQRNPSQSDSTATRANAAATEFERHDAYPADPVQRPNGPSRPSTHTAEGSNNRYAAERNNAVNRDAGAAGEALSAGPTMKEDANGDRRIISPRS